MRDTARSACESRSSLQIRLAGCWHGYDHGLLYWLDVAWHALLAFSSSNHNNLFFLFSSLPA